jgi:hypothetical protein
VHLTRVTENSVQTEPDKISLEVSNFDKLKQKMTKNLGTSSFIFSMILILLVALGFFMYLHFFVNPKEEPSTILNYQPVTTNPLSLTLNLSSPDDNLLVYDTNLLVSGQTTSGTLVLITINENNQTLNASKQGDFSQTVKLQSGINQVIVSVFDNQGNYKSEERSIYYSEEKL